jgi:hypothetical protein
MPLVAVKWESQSGFRGNQADLKDATCWKIQGVGLDQMEG